MITSIDVEKAFDKTQHPFLIIILSKIVIEGKVLNLMKGVHEKPQITSYLTVKNRVAFFSDFEHDHDVHPHHFYSTLSWRL